MKMLIVVLMTLFTMTAFASMKALNGSTSLGLVQELKCDSELTCSKEAGKRVVIELSGLQERVAATATTIVASQCGSTFYNSGAVEVELPEASAVLGCRLTFIVANATSFTIDPDAADQIMLLTNAAGDSLIADAVGESLVLEALSASQWAPVGAEKGTWTDSN